MATETTAAAFRRIMVGYDERPEGRDALHLGKVFAEATGATLLLASVFPYHEQGIGKQDLEQTLREAGERVFAPALDELGEAAETRALGNRSATDAIRDLAAEQDADLIVVGSTHRGSFGRVLPGSTALRLLSESGCPVAVAPRGFAGSAADDTMHVIAVAYDGSEQSDAALGVGCELAADQSATIRLITVNPPPHGYTFAAYDPRMRDSYRAAMDAAVTRIPPEVRPLGQLLDGDPARKILEMTELGVDLLVMGSHGWGPFGRMALGSVSAKVLAEASCPVLMVPTPVGRSLEPEPAGADLTSA